MKRLKTLIFYVLLIVSGTFYFLWAMKKFEHSTFKNSEIYVIKSGANIFSIAEDLQQKGVIDNEWTIIFYAYKNQLANRIKAGAYRVEAGMPTLNFLEDIVNGKVIVNKITVVEGKTFNELRQQLRENKNIKQTINDKTNAEIAQLLNINHDNPEGYFLPATYTFGYETTDFELLQLMQKTLVNYLHQAWEKRAENLPLKNEYEALILASIIEKETGIASERKEISGVFTRRLQQNMRLQTDPTVIYGISDYQGVITKKHLQTDTPYNTYTRSGLPPTPIALAGKESIDAALHPAEGNSLFFVANGKGGHTFSRTYEEHLQAVKIYREKK